MTGARTGVHDGGGGRRGRVVACAVAFMLVSVGAAARTLARPTRPPAVVTRAWPVMGTMFVASAWGDDTVALLRAVHAARDSVRLVDSLMSNYRTTSELSAINRAAGSAAVRVSPQLLAVLRQARTYWRLTGGAFDPTVGPLVAAWGFHGGRGRIPPPRELDSLRALVDFGAVEIDDAARTVRLPRAGMRLDLGGIAKGYALDLGRAAMRASDVHSGMLDLGGNILVFGPSPSGARWRLGVRHPRGDGIIGIVEMDSGAIATSGDYEHFYVIDGVRFAHLIDPRTGRPARGMIAATVVAPFGRWSDGLSASLYLAGIARGRAIADSLHEIAALWVPDRGDAPLRCTSLVLSARAAARFTCTLDGEPARVDR